MKFLTFLALVAAVVASPANRKRRPAVTLEGNPFESYTLHANSHYSSLVEAGISNLSDSSLEPAAQVVKETGTFLWLDTISTIETFESYLQETGENEIFGVVIYDLPGRDCAAKASNGELAVGELDRYKSEYIDPIVAIIKNNPDIAIAAIIEPDSLPNLVTNSDLTTCQNSASGYEEGVAYALSSLDLPNVVQYVDAGHGGWLGWDANLKPGAEELAKVYKAAGSPSNVRGISTNVAGWNAWSKNPGEFENAPDGQYNKCQDEQRYVTIFGEALATAGFPNHAIVDTARNGVQGLRDAWGDWCNVIGAGIGVRPTADTGEELADAFVWVKPAGESDGTSDSSATRYDSMCGLDDAYKPSPEAGAWNQPYFEELLKNANPSLA
ncbi:glycoside hydrolase family 6 protein [Schizophyllum commune Tattone D]|nr:glycoside hydrolase family 6 protein [Schizophyllum commune Loenen D]KAI5832034.1 glycoside hydrolase family 6 protein [Schizophyllum commune Tattone D]